MEIIRAFFAIDLTVTLRTHLTEILAPFKTAHQDISIHWSEPEHFHITLQFIRAFAREDIHLLIENVKHSLRYSRRFKVKLHELELFPSPRYPRMIAISIEPNEALSVLAKQIGQGILATNYAIEKRPFRPHLTLGRFNKRPPENFSFAEVPAVNDINIIINKVFLYESHPQARCSRYLLLHEFNL